MNLISKVLGLFSRSLLILIAGMCAIAFGAYIAFLTYQTVFYIPNVNVPSVLRLELDTAQKTLHQNGLKMKVINNPVFSEGDLFFITSQSPSAGTVVKKNRTVEVEIGGTGVTHQIPDLIGKTIEEAEILLSESDYRIGDIAYSNHHQIPQGRIIAQTPKPGGNIYSDGEINILVSKGLY
jgi:beta-lactam-binding protein with PASTA domain